VQVYVDQYPQKVRYLYKENGGVASALNVGIREARGDYLAWLSADDVFYPTKLEKQLQEFEMHPEIGLCYTDLQVIDSSGRLLKNVRCSYYPNREDRLRELLFKPYINGSTVMFRRECVERLGVFDEELNYTADLDFWYRVLSHYEVRHVKEFLVGYRWHERNDSRNDARYQYYREKLFKKLLRNPDITSLFPGETAQTAHLKLGKMLTVKRLFSLAEEQYRKAFLPKHPIKFRLYLMKHRFCDRPRYILRAWLVWRVGWYRETLIKRLLKRLLGAIVGG
jgi:glycosyltransferase involved in cell wall biosynthesis